jgi:SPW repeat
LPDIGIRHVEVSAKMRTATSVLVRLASGMNALLGLWLMFSPSVYGFAAARDSDTWASLIAGGIIMTFGALRAVAPRTSPALSWANMVFGAGTLIAPWIFNYSSDELRLWTSAGIGAAVLVLGTASGAITTMTESRLERAW